MRSRRSTQEGGAVTAPPRTKPSWTWHLRLIVGIAVIAACSAPASQPSSGISPGGGSTSASTTPAARPSSSPTTQSATDAGADELAARFPRTAAGAEAFVRAYFDALGKAFAAGDPAGLSDYSTPACLRCEGFLRTLTGDHDHGRHGVGTFAIIYRVTPTAVTTTSAVVDVDFDSPAAYVVDAQGTRVDERTAELSLRLRVRLEHSDHWRIVATELNP